MNTTQLLQAKASGCLDRSDGIVVSFDAKWHRAITSKSFSLVIRKRIPTKPKVNWLYFHVNSPISAICARAHVKSIGPISKKLLDSYTSELCLDSVEIEEYCKNLKEIGSYRIDEIELAPKEASVALLQEHLLYSPPQSFMYLSLNAKAIIDSTCEFTVI